MLGWVPSTLGLALQLAKFPFWADSLVGNAGTCGTCGKQVVAAAVIMRQRFSEAPIRKQAKVLGPSQDQVWSVRCRGSGGGVLGRGLTPAAFYRVGRTEQGKHIGIAFHPRQQHRKLINWFGISNSGYYHNETFKKSAFCIALLGALGTKLTSSLPLIFLIFHPFSSLLGCT